MSFNCELYKLRCSILGTYDVVQVWYKDTDSDELIFFELSFESIDYEDKFHYHNKMYFKYLNNEDILGSDIVDENYSCFDFLVSEYHLPLYCELLYSKKYSRYFINPLDWKDRK